MDSLPDTLKNKSPSPSPRSGIVRFLVPITAGLLARWLVYRNLAAFSAWFTYQVLPMEKGSHLASAVEFFIFETPKVLMLLTLVVFFVGIIRDVAHRGARADRSRPRLTLAQAQTFPGF